MGPAHVSNNSILMSPMEYYRPSVGAWTFVTNMVAGVDVQEAGYYTTPPSYYSYGIFSRAFSNDGVNIYTVDH